MIRDGGFRHATMNGIDDIVSGFIGGHDQELRNGVLGVFALLAMIVDETNLGFDEARENQGYADTFGGQFDVETLSERADGRFAHGIIHGSGGDGKRRHAADDGESPAGFFEVGQGGLNCANHSENVGFELAAKVIQAELGKGAVDPDAGIGNDDIDSAEVIANDIDGLFQVSIARDVARDGDGATAQCANGGGGGFEGFFAPGEERDVGAFAGEATTQSGADAGGSAGDEDGLS